MLQIGEPAPLFEAESTQGTVKLGELIGKRPVVLIFYPMDETPGCTAQLCAVRDSKKQYESIGAVVIGVNPAGMDAHRKFAANHGLDFPIAVDEGGSIRKMYGVGKMLGLFLQQRVVYGIDKQGKIAFARKGSPSAEEIVAALGRA
ncbi:MAG: peroxiredoxin [Paenibacillus sp.]|jgi:peroxiredoxin Q/BCP|nr:peroxiredoxin [Paenibacillus sp.]